MNIIHAIFSSVVLVSALLQQPQGHNVFILVVDRNTNEGIPAEVIVGDWQTRTEKGKATFYAVIAGKHRLAIIADDDKYSVVNWIITVPQTEAAIFRLEKRR